MKSPGEFLAKKTLSRGALGVLSALALTGLSGCVPGPPTYKAIRIPKNALQLPEPDGPSFVVYPQDAEKVYCGHMHLPNFIWNDNDNPDRETTPYHNSGLVIVTCKGADKDYPIQRFDTHSGEVIATYLQDLQKNVATQVK